MAKTQKRCASKLRYLSPSVVPLPGFETRLTNIWKRKFALTNKYGCTTYDTVVLKSVEDYQVFIADQVDIEMGSIHALPFIVSGGITDTIFFDPPQDIFYIGDTIHITASQEKLYLITFMDQNGCIVTKYVAAKVKASKPSFIMPNTVIITSGNIENSLFYLKSPGVFYDMTIYDRWGNLMFNIKNIESGNPESGWSPDKSNIQSGVYVYYMKIYTSDKVIQKAGTVTVL